MSYLKIVIAVLALNLTGCASIKYLQPGSDFVPAQVSPEKSVVVIQASFGDAQKPVLFITKKIEGGFDYGTVTTVDTVEFANYEGAVIPFYSSKDPFGIHAFYIEPGKYVIMRCVYGAPEIEWCIPGAWKEGEKIVGLPTFEIKAGEVVNVGNLNFNRKRQVQIINNHKEAIEYIEATYPNLSDRLEYKPMTFTKW